MSPGGKDSRSRVPLNLEKYVWGKYGGSEKCPECGSVGAVENLNVWMAWTMWVGVDSVEPCGASWCLILHPKRTCTDTQAVPRSEPWQLQFATKAARLIPTSTLHRWST